MSLTEEKHLLDSIVNVIPVADIPELIVEKVGYNPFDKNRILNDMLEGAIIYVREQLRLYQRVKFQFFRDFDTVKILKQDHLTLRNLDIPTCVYTKIEKFLEDAKYDRTIYRMDEGETIAYSMF